MLIRIGLKSDFLHSTLSLELWFLRCFTLNSTNLYPKKFANYGLTFKTSLDLCVIGHPKLGIFFLLII